MEQGFALTIHGWSPDGALESEAGGTDKSLITLEMLFTLGKFKLGLESFDTVQSALAEQIWLLGRWLLMDVRSDMIVML